MTTFDIWKRNRSSWVKLSMAAGLIAAMLGCGHEATAPVVETYPSASYEISSPAPPVTPVSAPVTGQVISTSKRISALLGGTITAGRHTLVIPPAALRRDTIITLRDVTGVMGRVECEALPEGLAFRLPATLITRFSDLTPLSGYAMYCVVNEGTDSEEWVLVGGQISAGNLGISALLHHFSKYAPGKTGW